MDPQAAWNQLQAAHCAGDWETARELAQSLLDWLQRGGFPPVTADAEAQESAQHRAVATRFCRATLQLADPLLPSDDNDRQKP